jgi:WD40 repeat protein
MHAVTALAWIPCGVTPPVLLESNTTEQEINAYLAVIGGPRERPEPVPESISPEDAAIIARYDLEHYDDDEARPTDIVVDDPYQTGPVEPTPLDEDDQIRPTDLLLMVGKTGDQIPSLEVHLFDSQEESFFVHHEMMIPSFPLSIRWLDCEPLTLGGGSFGAISTFEKHIEIWNMNLAEPLHPNAALQFHEDAVPGLSWNVLQRGVLLSASIDTRAAIWSLESCQTAAVFEIGAPCKFAEWNPANASVFGIASEAGCGFFEARQPTALFSVSDGLSVETFFWDTGGDRFLIGDLNGFVSMFDRRQPGAPIAQLQAHPVAVTSLSLCRAAPVFASTGEDGFCRIWRIDDTGIVPVAEEHMNEGRIYASAFSPDRPTLLAVGGDGEDAQLWDIANLLERMAE